MRSLELVQFVNAENEPTDGLVSVRKPELVASPYERAILLQAAIFKHIDYVFFRRFRDAEGHELRSPQVLAYVVDNSTQKITEQEAVLAADTVGESKVDTTAEELEGFMIVKTILRQKISSSRIAFRDAQSYFAILLDDNNRKTICRLYLNGSKKYFAFIDEQKKEVRNEIATLDDIFNFAELLHKIVAAYDSEKKGSS